LRATFVLEEVGRRMTEDDVERLEGKAPEQLVEQEAANRFPEQLEPRGDGLCPKCGSSNLGEGYGLAGGGVGSYQYCDDCDWFYKTQDPGD
jgi:hypothetical protein